MVVVEVISTAGPAPEKPARPSPSNPLLLLSAMAATLQYPALLVLPLAFGFVEHLHPSLGSCGADGEREAEKVDVKEGSSIESSRSGEERLAMNEYYNKWWSHGVMIGWGELARW